MTSTSEAEGPARHLGGQQPDVAPARNLLADAGLRLPDGRVPSEALIFGLAGGIGFLYGAFEYRTPDGVVPTLTIVPRNSSQPDPFLAPLFARVGLAPTVAETGGARTAARQLDAYLAAGRSVLLSVGEGHLPYLGLRADEAAMAPRVVRALGYAETAAGAAAAVLVDDRSPTPHAVPRAALDAARAAHRQSRHRLVAVEPATGTLDWAAAVLDAVQVGAAGYDTPPVPAYAANIGTAGLRKWSTLLTSTRDPKRWPKVYGAGRSAAIALTRLYDCVTHDYTSPAASRPLYADFLVEAAALSGRDELAAPVGELREAGSRWARVAELASGVDDVTRRHAELSDHRAALLAGGGDPEAASSAVSEQRELVAGSTLAAGTAAAVYAEIATLVTEIAELETAAVGALAAVRHA